jgi:16S rRNA (cytosine967-C5)-methyltransferase
VTNTRTSAARVIDGVVTGRRSLDAALAGVLPELGDARERALVQELAYGTLRWYFELDAVLGALLNKPLKRRDSDLRCLLLSGLYQLRHLSIPVHAAINESVQAARVLDKPWATGMVNAVLRNSRRHEAKLVQVIADSQSARFAHPGWLVKRVRKDWPDDWQSVLEAGNRRPPFVLRVNRLRYSREDYLELLQQQAIEAQPLNHAGQGVRLGTPVPVDLLPGFADGAVSVQDGAAQLAAVLLDLSPGQRVLDACAAPGGKTAHILESEPALAGLTAVDIDAQRVRRIHAGLDRLGLKAEVLTGDAAQPQQWWDGMRYDRILLDAPCSASGVIRRHPDIKLLRRPADITALAAQQAAMLEAMWPLLSAGGMLLYTTCSILAEENEHQVARFLSDHADAESRVPDAGWGRACVHGRQLLSGEDDMDGFYFACIYKV